MARELGDSRPGEASASEHTETTDPGTEEQLLSRRGYLGLIAAATGTVGVLGVTSDQAAEATIAPTPVYGYGGTIERDSKPAKAVTTATESDETRSGKVATSARLVDHGEDVDASLGHTDTDWYAFDGSRDTDAMIELSVQATSSPTPLLLYAPDGDFVASAFAEADTRARLVVTLPVAGTYFIEIPNILGTRADYNLEVTVPYEGSLTATSLGMTTTTAPTSTQTGQGREDGGSGADAGGGNRGGNGGGGGNRRTNTPTETATATETPTATRTTTKTQTTTETATATRTATETDTTTDSELEDDYGEQGYGQFGYGGVEG